MSKELDKVFSAFGTIIWLLTNDRTGTVMGRKELSIIEQAIIELNYIKEANPSEAMKCLENIGNWELANSCMEKVNESDEFVIVKQALLKAQEQEKELEKYKEAVEYLMKTYCISAIKIVKN